MEQRSEREMGKGARKARCKAHAAMILPLVGNSQEQADQSIAAAQAINGLRAVKTSHLQQIAAN
jgi:hypothetical protein